MSYKGYNPDKDMPSLNGKVILITGGTAGIGRTAVLELAKHSPKHVYFTGRNETTATALVAECASSGYKDVTFLRCDHGSLESVRRAAEDFSVAENRLDVFIANAGIMAVPAGLTTDGYEVQFGTNHVGNAALLLRLLPTMAHTAEEPGSDVRFVVLTSLGYFLHSKAGIEFDGLHTTQESMGNGTWGRYGQSKLANILFAHELGRRLPKICAVAVHPGVVGTGLVKDLRFWHKALVYVTSPLGMMTPREGSFNTLWAATSPQVKEMMGAKGSKAAPAFFEPVGRPNAGDAACRDEALAARLWEWTQSEVGLHV